MAGYTKADMATIFRQGIQYGLWHGNDDDTSALAKEIADDFFGTALAGIRDEKKKAQANHDPRKAFDEWVRNGRPKNGAPMFPEVFE